MKFRNRLDSRSSNTPSRAPSSVMALKSARLNTLLFLPLNNKRVINWLTTTSGASTSIIIFSVRTVNAASSCQYIAPSVFGIISDRINIASVMTTGITIVATIESPQITAA